MNTFLSVFVVASMAALVAVWRIGDFIPFYVVLTAVMAVAAGVNLFMVFRRVHGLKEDLSPGEYRSAGVLLWMVTMVLSAVGGVCFAFAVNERIVASYPVIFSAVPVFMLLINGYINFIEAHVRERKIEMERQIAESNDVSD
jgi:drug/metabolite transporter (DMT)-like permease